MVFYRRIIMAVFVMTLTGCASKNVDWDYDPGQPLTHLEGYAWMENDKAREQNGYHTDALEEQRIRNSVNSIMQAMGYRLANSKDDANFLVNYTTSVQSRVEGQQLTTSVGFGRRGYGVGVSNDNLISEYDERTLTVDFVDPETKNVIWRGRSRTRVQNKLSPEQRTERVNQEIMNILSGFPEPVK